MLNPEPKRLWDRWIKRPELEWADIWQPDIEITNLTAGDEAGGETIYMVKTLPGAPDAPIISAERRYQARPAAGPPPPPPAGCVCGGDHGGDCRTPNPLPPTSAAQSPPPPLSPAVRPPPTGPRVQPDAARPLPL